MVPLCLNGSRAALEYCRLTSRWIGSGWRSEFGWFVGYSGQCAAPADQLKGNYGTHSLRKTWGYQARMQGVDLALIMHKLNHESTA